MNVEFEIVKAAPEPPPGDGSIVLVVDRTAISSSLRGTPLFA